jgi:hypothetical protein
MTRPHFGVTLAIRIDALPSGSRGALRSGLRPLCRVTTPDGDDVVIGLCELELAHPVHPGGAGDGRLSFDIAVSDLVRSLIRAGSRLTLAEGNTPIATAEVRAIES